MLELPIHLSPTGCRGALVDDCGVMPRQRLMTYICIDRE